MNDLKRKYYDFKNVSDKVINGFDDSDLEAGFRELYNELKDEGWQVPQYRKFRAWVIESAKGRTMPIRVSHLKLDDEETEAARLIEVLQKHGYHEDEAGDPLPLHKDAMNWEMNKPQKYAGGLERTLADAYGHIDHELSTHDFTVHRMPSEEEFGLGKTTVVMRGSRKPTPFKRTSFKDWQVNLRGIFGYKVDELDQSRQMESDLRKVGEKYGDFNTPEAKQQYKFIGYSKGGGTLQGAIHYGELFGVDSLTFNPHIANNMNLEKLKMRHQVIRTAEDPASIYIGLKRQSKMFQEDLKVIPALDKYGDIFGAHEIENFSTDDLDRVATIHDPKSRAIVPKMVTRFLANGMMRKMRAHLTEVDKAIEMRTAGIPQVGDFLRSRTTDVLRDVIPAEEHELEPPPDFPMGDPTPQAADPLPEGGTQLMDLNPDSDLRVPPSEIQRRATGGGGVDSYVQEMADLSSEGMSKRAKSLEGERRYGGGSRDPLPRTPTAMAQERLPLPREGLGGTLPRATPFTTTRPPTAIGTERTKFRGLGKEPEPKMTSTRLDAGFFEEPSINFKLPGIRKIDNQYQLKNLAMEQELAELRSDKGTAAYDKQVHKFRKRYKAEKQPIDLEERQKLIEAGKELPPLPENVLGRLKLIERQFQAKYGVTKTQFLIKRIIELEEERRLSLGRNLTPAEVQELSFQKRNELEKIFREKKVGFAHLERAGFTGVTDAENADVTQAGLSSMRTQAWQSVRDAHGGAQMSPEDARLIMNGGIDVGAYEGKIPPSELIRYASLSDDERAGVKAHLDKQIARSTAGLENDYVRPYGAAIKSGITKFVGGRSMAAGFVIGGLLGAGENLIPGFDEMNQYESAAITGGLTGVLTEGAAIKLGGQAIMAASNVGRFVTSGISGGAGLVIGDFATNAIMNAFGKNANPYVRDIVSDVAGGEIGLLGALGVGGAVAAGGALLAGAGVEGAVAAANAWNPVGWGAAIASVFTLIGAAIAGFFEGKSQAEQKAKHALEKKVISYAGAATTVKDQYNYIRTYLSEMGMKSSVLDSMDTQLAAELSNPKLKPMTTAEMKAKLQEWLSHYELSSGTDPHGVQTSKEMFGQFASARQEADDSMLNELVVHLNQVREARGGLGDGSAMGIPKAVMPKTDVPYDNVTFAKAWNKLLSDNGALSVASGMKPMVVPSDTGVHSSISLDPYTPKVTGWNNAQVNAWENEITLMGMGHSIKQDVTFVPVFKELISEQPQLSTIYQSFIDAATGVKPTKAAATGKGSLETGSQASITMTESQRLQYIAEWKATMKEYPAMGGIMTDLINAANSQGGILKPTDPTTASHSEGNTATNNLPTSTSQTQLHSGSVSGTGGAGTPAASHTKVIHEAYHAKASTIANHIGTTGSNVASSNLAPGVVDAVPGSKSAARNKAASLTQYAYHPTPADPSTVSSLVSQVGSKVGVPTKSTATQVISSNVGASTDLAAGQGHTAAQNTAYNIAHGHPPEPTATQRSGSGAVIAPSSTVAAGNVGAASALTKSAAQQAATGRTLAQQEAANRAANAAYAAAHPVARSGPITVTGPGVRG